MDRRTLVEGYRRVVTTLYDSTLENYFSRCLTLFEHLRAVPHLLKPKSKDASYGELMVLRKRLSAEQVFPLHEVHGQGLQRPSPHDPEGDSRGGRGYHFERMARTQAAVHEVGES